MTLPLEHTGHGNSIQALELLRYAVDELHFAPERISLMGDSSGGNLIFTVLSHLMRTHPDLVKSGIEPLKLSGPLKAAVACSPVTVLEHEQPTLPDTCRTGPGQWE